MKTIRDLRLHFHMKTEAKIVDSFRLTFRVYVNV
jgi:hypothetical protein